MTTHDTIRLAKAQSVDRNNVSDLWDAIGALQSTDDPSPAIAALHHELQERVQRLEAEGDRPFQNNGLPK